MLHMKHFLLLVEVVLTRSETVDRKQTHELTRWSLGHLDVILKMQFLVLLISIFKSYTQMNAKGPYWWKVNIGSGNGMMPSDNKPFPEPMKTQILVTIGHNGSISEQSFTSVSDKTSHSEISWSLEATRLSVWIIASLWNLTGTLAALLPRCVSNFRVIIQFSQLQNFARSEKKTSYPTLKWGQATTIIWTNNTLVYSCVYMSLGLNELNNNSKLIFAILACMRHKPLSEPILIYCWFHPYEQTSVKY